MPTIALAPLLVLLGCGEPSTDTGVIPAAIPPGSARRVVVLVIDGVRWDESFSAEISPVTGSPGLELMPEVNRRLLPQAALCSEAMSAGVTITAAGHHDLITGVRAEYGNFPNDNGAGAYRPELPTLFEQARHGLGLKAEEVVFIANTVLVEGVTWSLQPGLGSDLGATWDFIHDPDDEDKPAQEDQPVADAVSAHLAAGARLIVANLHDADRAGHYGSANAYPNNVLLQDEQIATIWSEIVQDPRLKHDTALIVVADHGRHRTNPDSEGWREHGDQCAGCRQVPLMVLGPGIAADTRIDTPIFLEDVTQTIAWWMGFDLPYGTGRVLTELFEDPTSMPTPTLGTHRVALDGLAMAEEVHTGLPTQRSQIQVDGETLSDPDALAAEGPTLSQSSEGTAVCHRELHLGGDDATWPWSPRCHLKSGRIWVDIGAPVSIVNPHWAPALSLARGNTLHMAFVDNSNGIVAQGRDPTTIRWARWGPTSGWQGVAAGISDISLPTHPSLALKGGDAWIAFGTSDSGPSGRDTRHIQLHRGTWPDLATEPTFTRLYQTLGMALDGEPLARMERPALRVRGPRAQLAFLGILADDQAAVIQVESADGGATWSEPTRVDSGGAVLPHISPHITSTGTLLWAQVDTEGKVEICTSGTQAGCRHTGQETIQSLELTSTGIVFTSRQDDHSWAVHSLDL